MAENDKCYEVREEGKRSELGVGESHSGKITSELASDSGNQLPLIYQASWEAAFPVQGTFRDVPKCSG